MLYTDGVTEAADSRGEMMGEDRLYALLAELPADLEARAIVDRVREAGAVMQSAAALPPERE